MDRISPIFIIFALILTNYAAVIVTAPNYRFKCKSHSGFSSVCPLFGKRNFLFFFFRKIHYFKMVSIVSTSHISYKRVSTEYWKVENVFLKHI